MAFARWDPIRDLLAIQQRLDRFAPGPAGWTPPVERGHGSFSRTFHLPVPVDGDRIAADLRDGVLTVTCPKAPEGGGRRIHITT
jgi:HSP20 family molecular chaperone IbpA